MMFRRIASVTVVAVMLVSGGLINAHAQSDGASDDKVSPVPYLEWSVARLPGSDLSRSFERLYVTLHNLNLLPVQTYKNEDANRQVVQIMQDIGLRYGDYFPVGIDSVVCDLNPPEVCDRDRVPAKNLEDISSHVGGYEFSRGRWKNSGETQTLYLPGIEIRKVTGVVRMLKPSGTSLFDLVALETEDCASIVSLPDPCTSITKLLNLHNEDAFLVDAETMVLVPYHHLYATISVDGPMTGTVAEAFRNPSDGFSPEWQALASKTKKSEAILLALEDRVTPYGTGVVFQQVVDAKAEPHYAQQEDLLTAISHPFKDAGELPDNMNAEVTIVVADNRIDDNHCELEGRIELSDGALTAATLPAVFPTAANCGDTFPQSLPEYNHGTHVAGLIAGRVNHRASFGLNPHAKIAFLSLNEDDFVSNESTRKSIGALLLPGIYHGATLLNLSWGYEPYGSFEDDYFYEALFEKHVGAYLVVAAAGNDVSEYRRGGGGCKLYPACFGSNLDNLISVVGLTSDIDHPEVWRRSNRVGSNFGTGYDIAAVAQDVHSLGVRNFTGRASGTSMATPQVTAAASLIRSVLLEEPTYSGKSIPPSKIKHRLMYTADVFPHLIDKVYSGRLNVARAVDLRNDFVVLRDGTELTGRIDVLGAKRGIDPGDCLESPESTECNSDLQCEREDGTSVYIPINSVRRMHNLAGKKYRYVVFHNVDSVVRDGEQRLTRISDCYLRSRSQSMVILVPKNGDEEEQTFRFDEIGEYYSRFKALRGN